MSGVLAVMDELLSSPFHVYAYDLGDLRDGLEEARATVAELIAALQEIHYFTREGRRCEADRVRWLAERAERALRGAGVEPQSLSALARAAGGQS